MDRNNLLNEVKKYSNYKTLGVLPPAVLALFSSIIFVLSVLLSSIINIPMQVLYISAILMFLGILIPVITLTIQENKRKKIIMSNFSETFDIFIEILKDKIVLENLNKFQYWDLLDIFYNYLVINYQSSNPTSTKMMVNNELKLMFKEIFDNNSKSIKFLGNINAISTLFKNVSIVVDDDNYLSGTVYNMYGEYCNIEATNLEKRKLVNLNLLYQIIYNLMKISVVVFIILEHYKDNVDWSWSVILTSIIIIIDVIKWFIDYRSVQ